MDKNLYLPEDIELLNQFDNLGPAETPGKVTQIARLQAEATLRARKTMVDLDNVNSKFSIIVIIFTVVQVFIATLAFVLQVEDSSNRVLAIGVSIIFVIGTVAFPRYFDKFYDLHQNK